MNDVDAQIKINYLTTLEPSALEHSMVAYDQCDHYS